MTISYPITLADAADLNLKRFHDHLPAILLAACFECRNVMRLTRFLWPVDELAVDSNHYYCKNHAQAHLTSWARP